MPDSPTPDWEGDRDYLLVLARMTLPPWLRAKVDPSDVVHTAFAKAIEHRDQFRGDGIAPRRAWLRVILVNVVRDTIRRFKGSPALQQSIEISLNGSSAKLDDMLAANDSTPGQMAVKLDELRRLTYAIEALPTDQRMAIDLKHLRGWTVRQIAEHMNKSAEAIGGLLRRGMRTLRDNLAADSGESNVADS
jgi:RNA polymerase sigma-70 factor (ECF subfamily)